MSEYRFVSFVPVAGEWSGRGVLCRSKDRSEGDTWREYPEDNFNPAEVDMLEFIRPADSESPSEPVPATIQATPAMTVREQFAMAAMQEALRLNKYKLDRIPVIAACIADTLIDEINRTKGGK